MFEAFTDRARRVVVLAQEEARRLSHDHIGTEHLLLGLIVEQEGLAAQALADAGVELDGARRGVESLSGRGETAPSGHMPFTQAGRQTLAHALLASGRLGQNFVGTEHLLLGLLADEENRAVQVLQHLGIDPADLRAETIELIGEPWQPEAPRPADADRRPERAVLVVPSRSTSKERLDEIVAAVRDLSGHTAVVLHWQAGGPHAHHAIVDRYEEDGPEPAAAVVILGPDDADEADVAGRRRPGLDVVYELGWLHGELGRQGVVVLVEEGVETPGSIGIPYYPLDAAGTWRRSLDDGLHAALDELDVVSFVHAQPIRFHRVSAPSYFVPGTGLRSRLLRPLSWLRWLWPWRP